MPQHLKVDLSIPEQEKAWKNLSQGDMASIEEGSPSLLELNLEAGGFDPDLLNLLKRLKEAMECFWQDRSINHPLIAKKDITHNRRLLSYIERFLFPSTQWRGESASVPCIYDHLDLYDAFVLLCSVYVHDYGKGQFLLIIPELPENQQKPFEDACTAAELMKEHELLERYHTHTINEFMEIFCKHSADVERLKSALSTKYKHGGLESYINSISSRQDFAEQIPTAGKPDAGTAQIFLFNILWKLAARERPGSNQKLLKEIQIVSRSHKPYRPLSGTEVDPFDDIDIGGQNGGVRTLALLAALLRLGDNLDMTYFRLERKSALRADFDKWLKDGAPSDKFSEPRRRLFMKWWTFAVVPQVKIEHKFNPPSTLTVEVIVQYWRFANWQKHLLSVRNLVEKDFVFTNFLKALQRLDDGGKIDLRLLYEMASPKLPDDDPAGISPVGVIGDLEKRLAEMGTGGRGRGGQKYCLLKPRDTNPESFLGFSTLPEDLEIPSSRDLLYLLGFLDTYGRTKCDEIARRMALGFCRDLHQRWDLEGDTELLRISQTEREVDFVDEAARRRVSRMLQTFREYPALLCQKIQELEKFGRLLPFSPRDSDTIPTGIDGLDKILSPEEKDSSRRGFRHSRNILLVGGPGTGKTTLIVQILHWNLRYTQRSVLLLTFEELVPVLVSTYREHFGWEASSFVRPIQPDTDPDETLSRIHREIENYRPDLIGIDGLSRLRRVYSDNDKRDKHREVVDTLFKSLQIRGITCIATLEERSAQGPAEEYQADGVVHLSMRSEARRLEIEKLRSQAPVAGSHALEIMDDWAVSAARARWPEKDRYRHPCSRGINVYPNEQYYALEKEGFSGKVESPELQYIPTGVHNLDSLLPGTRGGRGGYHRGDAILVLGSPGAGKTLFGLHFLKAEFDSQSDHSPDRRVLWLSFEGPKRMLRRSVASFEPAVGFTKLLDLDEFLFEFVPPALLSPEKVLYFVTELVERFEISRIVVDSVSEISEAFGDRDKVRFRQYMTTFIHVLARANVTSMFLYRVPGFFRSGRESESEIATLVDTIISIKTFDMKNKIRRGLFVLKSRGRELRSQLQTMDIHAKHGIQLSYKGWEMEGLLSGETGSIHEPEVFLKHFYENPAESKINEDLVKEFERRYANKGRFTQVRKPAIYSEFWSFRGHYGAGHANIRVVSISRYMVEAFRELDSLHELDEDFFPEKLKEQIRKEIRWSRYETAGHHCDSIPLYTDMGFLVARRDLAKVLLKRLKDLDLKESQWLFTDGSDSATFGELVPWDGLKDLARDVGTRLKEDLARDVGTRPKDKANLGATGTALARPYVFALPYLYNQTEFMALFFEILWSNGGDVYHFPIFDTPEEISRDAFYKNHIFLNKHLWRELIRIVNAAQPPGTPIYDLSEIHKRIQPLLGVLLGVKGAIRDCTEDDVRSEMAVNEEELKKLRDLKRFVRLVTTHILESCDFSIDDADVITISNQFGRRALEFLYDLVFDSYGTIPNPYDGDFRAHAVFSRRWYSQIQGIPAEIVGRNSEEEARQLRPERRNEGLSQEAVPPTSADDLVVLPLPYFTDNGRKRSCTYENVWCLSLIKQALSPEIGWIYIDTLTSREWVERRAAKRCGFPYRLEEIESMERHDPKVYAMLHEIVRNKQQKDRIYDAESKLVAEYPGCDAAEERRRVEEAVKEFFRGKYHHRDIGDVLAYFARHRQRRPALVERENLFERELKRVVGGKLFKSMSAGQAAVSELPEFEDFGARVALGSKLPAHRPLFHRVESILHDEIVSLFSPQGRRLWYSVLRKETPVGLDEDIDKALAVARKEEKERRQMEGGLVARALERMRDRLIFDLLTGLPNRAADVLARTEDS